MVTVKITASNTRSRPRADMAASVGNPGPCRVDGHEIRLRHGAMPALHGLCRRSPTRSCQTFIGDIKEPR